MSFLTFLTKKITNKTMLELNSKISGCLHFYDTFQFIVNEMQISSPYIGVLSAMVVYPN